MTKYSRLVAVATVLTVISTAACGSKSPTSPGNVVTPQTETRIIAIEGALDFGAVQLGQSSTRSFTIRNTGNAALTVTGLSGPAGTGPLVVATWTGGTIPPNGSQEVQIRFTPQTTASFDGTVAINANQTSGTTSVPFRASGTLNGLPVFGFTGVGANVFTSPGYLTRVTITGNYAGFCENFVVYVSNRLVVNEILGTCSVASGRTYTGTLSVTGGEVRVEKSTGIHWTFTEAR